MALIGILLFFIIAYIALQSSWVQNKVVESVTSFLSSELNTEVHLDRVELSLFDEVSFEGLFVRDLKGDTLIYADRINAGLRNNILTLFWSRLEFDDILVRGATVHITRKEGEPSNNLQFILDYLVRQNRKLPQNQRKTYFLLLKTVPSKISSSLIQMQ